LTNGLTQSDYLFPSHKQEDYAKLNIPFTGNFFIGYKEAIAFKESQGKYRKINSLGYLGKYQFGPETLRTIGVYNNTAFLKNPDLQEKAFLALLSKNKWLLRKEIEKYEGTVINGIHITESGILAAAHLGGVRSVKRYFRSNGERYFRDAYGTSIISYMKAFGGYDTSFIEPDKHASISDI
ncbi:MAG: hypothetical protein RL311_1195, partial [Bacteroidota bacterium]